MSALSRPFRRPCLRPPRGRGFSIPRNRAEMPAGESGAAYRRERRARKTNPRLRLSHRAATGLKGRLEQQLGAYAQQGETDFAIEAPGRRALFATCSRQKSRSTVMTACPATSATTLRSAATATTSSRAGTTVTASTALTQRRRLRQPGDRPHPRRRRR